MKLSFIRARLGMVALVLAAGCTTDLSAPDGPQATTDLTGVVRDADGLPIADASISLIYTLGIQARATSTAAKPLTGISFSVPRGGAIVRLQILDRRQQVVRLLRDGPVTEGQHSAAWDGSDDKGKPAPNGIYNAQLELITEQGSSLEETKLFLLVIDLDELVDRPNARTGLNGRFVVPRDLIAVGEEIDLGPSLDPLPILDFVTVQAAIRTRQGIRRSIRDIQIPMEGDLSPLEFTLP